LIPGQASWPRTFMSGALTTIDSHGYSHDLDTDTDIDIDIGMDLDTRHRHGHSDAQQIVINKQEVYVC
jgi:hypothetical protein